MCCEVFVFEGPLKRGQISETSARFEFVNQLEMASVHDETWNKNISGTVDSLEHYKCGSSKRLPF
jgi:hypothetical protein